MTGVLFAPHADDETLFAAYTILRHRPAVVICFPSVRDYGDTDERTAESRAAMAILGAYAVEQWPGGDIEKAMRVLNARVAHLDRVWAPHPQASHPEHQAVAAAAAAVFGDRVSTYHTYDACGKVRAGHTVPIEDGWPDLKRRALRCYETQIQHPRARMFFAWDLTEYASDGA